MPFGGIKVLNIPIRIIGPTDAETNKSEVLYSHIGGLCFEGGYLGAYLVKEVISEVLSHLQTIDSADNLTFKRIADVAFNFYSHVCASLAAQNSTSPHNAGFLLGGFCPAEKRIRVFRFSLTSKMTPEICEVLLDSTDWYVTLGTGGKRFRELFEADLVKGGIRVHFQILQRIRSVIQDSSVPSVAGTVQYGEFDGTTKDFKLYGIADPYFENGILQRRLYVRGTDLETVHTPSDPLGLYVKYQFKVPFEEQ